MEPYIFKNKPLIINKFLMLSQNTFDKEKYDIFDCRLPNRTLSSNMEQEDIFDKLDFGYNNMIHKPNTITFLYAEVLCKEDAAVIINFRCSKRGKLFINDKIAVIHSREWIETTYYVCTFKKGINKIALEVVFETNELFSIQIRDYFKETNGLAVFSLAGTPDFSKLDTVTVVAMTDYIPTADIYKFMYLENTKEKYEENYSIEISDKKTGFQKMSAGKLGIPVEINLNELRKTEYSGMNFFTVRCEFEKKDGGIFSDERLIIIHNYENEINEIFQKSNQLLPSLPEAIANQLQGRIHMMDVNDDEGSARFWSAWMLDYFYEQIITGKNYQQYYLGFGTHEVYLKSALDGLLTKLVIRIPELYDPQKQKYPLFVSIGVQDCGENSFCFPEEKLIEPAIHVDVSGRGIMFGSYTSEASVKEILSWLLKTYPVDEDRVYAIGFSSGAYAAFALAQNYPDMFAAIYTIGGLPNLEFIDNLSNTPVFNIVSNYDNVYSKNPGALNKALNKYGNYYQFDLEDHIHMQLFPYRVLPSVLNQMLLKKRNPYPLKLVFSSNRARHLTSFWVGLSGIRPKKTKAFLNAEIINANYIKLNVKNAEGITVMLPSFMDRNGFQIVLNNKTYTFTNYKKRDRVCFYYHSNQYQLIQDAPESNVRKGTGLLDVYLTPMRIQMPKNSHAEDLRAAKQFSNPRTSGFISSVSISYPIWNNEPQEPHWSYSLILLDNGSGNHIAESITEQFQVKAYENGYEYRGEFYTGNYCIMQVVANPIDHEKSVLYVRYNNSRLLEKHILLRRVTIPTYIVGTHPYWNNNILVFDGEKYFAAYEQNEPLMEIGKTHWSDGNNLYGE